MLYTVMGPDDQGDRIRLYPSSATARELAGAGAGRPVRAVAARFDERARRVVPLWSTPELPDPAWSTPAELHFDGSVTARGPVPAALFLHAEEPGGPMPAPVEATCCSV